MNIKNEFCYQIKQGINALDRKDYKTSFYHLENAHILGQKHIIRHTMSHYWMLVLGIKSRNRKEIIGQVFRILASLLFTLFWAPKGNTGGTNVSPIKLMPIRKELKKYF